MSQTAVGFLSRAYCWPLSSDREANAARLWTRVNPVLAFGPTSKADEFLSNRREYLRLVVLGYFRCVGRFFFNIVPFLPTWLCNGREVESFYRQSGETALRSFVSVAMKTTNGRENDYRPVVMMTVRYGLEKYRRWWKTKTSWNRVLWPVGRCYIRFPKTCENKYVT